MKKEILPFARPCLTFAGLLPEWDGFGKNLKIGFDNLILKISFAQKKSNTHKKLYTTSTKIQRGKFKAKKKSKFCRPW